MLISSSDVIKCVTNVLHLTKTIEMFDVEERNAQSLTRQCPSVTVNGGSVCHLDAVNKVSTNPRYCRFSLREKSLGCKEQIGNERWYE